jgi:predicted transcriptional regulator
MKKSEPGPTASELEILQVLWEFGPSTVGFVNEKLNEKRKVGYTTTLKILQIMSEKGLVVRDETKRAHVYSARYSAENIEKRMVSDLIDRAFQGSTSRLVMQALASKPASEEELAEIRRLLDKVEGESR